MTSLALKGKDRRSTTRYAITMPLWYRPVGSTSDWLPGRTLDMSAGGILMAVHKMLPVGSRLEVKMDWPGLYHGWEWVSLAFIGAVTRSEGDRIALRIGSHRFSVGRQALARPQHSRKDRAVA